MPPSYCFPSHWVYLFCHFFREGSVIVSLILYFKTPVTTNDGLAELTDVLIMGTIGPFIVRCLKILDEDTTAPPSSISSTISLTSSAVPSPPTGGLCACIYTIKLFQRRILSGQRH